MKERTGSDGTMVNVHDDNAIVRNEEMALRLTIEAMRNGQRAAVGLLALPASLALGVAATISYAAAFLERGFETFERSLGRIARDAQALGEDRAGDRALFGSTPSGEQLTARS